MHAVERGSGLNVVPENPIFTHASANPLHEVGNRGNFQIRPAHSGANHIRRAQEFVVKQGIGWLGIGLKRKLEGLCLQPSTWPVGVMSAKKFAKFFHGATFQGYWDDQFSGPFAGGREHGRSMRQAVT
ncbi:hypothetical protein B4966_15080 [Rhodocyclaceae bacterium]|nr:hypothetical protein B4966_15080 [Rhodocyclaceae bacterium]